MENDRLRGALVDQLATIRSLEYAVVTNRNIAMERGEKIQELEATVEALLMELDGEDVL